MRMNCFLALSITLAMATASLANTFTAEGGLLDESHGYRNIADRFLIQDGSFENGTCFEGESDWTCTSDNDCDWIADLVPLGLWNFDGSHVAWLGGFCGGSPTTHTSICQSEYFSSGGCLGTLCWYWMAYVNWPGATITVTVDGVVFYEHLLQPEDHLLDYHPVCVSGDIAQGTHELCFNYYLGDEDSGSNYFVDFVEAGLFNPTPTDEFSFSVVKALY